MPSAMLETQPAMTLSADEGVTDVSLTRFTISATDGAVGVTLPSSLEPPITQVRCTRGHALEWGPCHTSTEKQCLVRLLG